MSARRVSRSAWIALSAGAAVLASSWMVERWGARDGARFGRAGAPVDVAFSASGDRVFVAAAEDRAIWVLDSASGRRVSRQGLDQAPTGLVPASGPPLLPQVLFTQTTETCELHPFRERTLASCHRPGDADVESARDTVPLVLGAVRDVDGSVVFALGRLQGAEPVVELRRYTVEPVHRQPWSLQKSRWLPVPRDFAYAERWPMVVDEATRHVLLALPGTSQLWVFDTELGFLRSVGVGPDPRGLAVLGDAGQALVADAELGQVWKVALDSGELLAKVDAGGGARAIAFDPRRGIAWVAASHADAILGLDPGSLRTLVRLPTREGTHALALDASGGRLIASNTRDGTVTCFGLGDVGAAERGATDRRTGFRTLWQATP
ncbi:MAG: hypothetical protein U0610_07000 [bacterium]